MFSKAKTIFVACALTLLAISQLYAQATLIWSDEFNGTAGAALDSSKWLNTASGVIATDGTDTYANMNQGDPNSVTGANMPSLTHGNTYTIEYKFRFSVWPPKNVSDNGFIGCGKTTDSYPGTFDIALKAGSTANPPTAATAYMGIRGMIADSAGNGAWCDANWVDYFSGSVTGSSTGWQTLQIVLGPSVQRFFVNGRLVDMFHQSIDASIAYVPIIGGSSLAPVQFDYVRVYSGDNIGWPEDQLFIEKFDATRTCAPNIDTWNGNNALQVSGAGDGAGDNDGYFRHKGGASFRTQFGYGQVFAAPVMKLDTAKTFEFYTRFPLARPWSLATLGEQEYFGVVYPLTGNKFCKFYRLNIGNDLTTLKYVINGTRDSNDLYSFFSGNPQTDFQKIAVVLSTTAQTVYINDVKVTQSTAQLSSIYLCAPYMDGSTATNAITNEPQTDKIKVLEGDEYYVAPTQVTTDQWRCLNRLSLCRPPC